MRLVVDRMDHFHVLIVILVEGLLIHGSLYGLNLDKDVKPSFPVEVFSLAALIA